MDEEDKKFLQAVYDLVFHSAQYKFTHFGHFADCKGYKVASALVYPGCYNKLSDIKIPRSICVTVLEAGSPTSRCHRDTHYLCTL